MDKFGINWSLRVLAVVIGFSFVLTLSAQEIGQEKNEKIQLSEEMSTAKLATEMVIKGYKDRDPLLLAKAADMLAKIGIQDLKVEKSEPGKKNEGEKEKQQTLEVNLDVVQIINDAIVMAENDSSVLMVVKKIQEQIKSSQEAVSKGRVGGPTYATRTVYGGSTYTDYIYFSGETLAEVAVIGDGDTDLDLYLYDTNGNLIDYDIRYGDGCYVACIPYYTQLMTVVVKNLGWLYNNYILITN